MDMRKQFERLEELAEISRRHEEFNDRERRIRGDGARGDALTRYSSSGGVVRKLNNYEYVLPASKYRSGSPYKYERTYTQAPAVSATLTPLENAKEKFRIMADSGVRVKSSQHWDVVLTLAKQALAEQVAAKNEQLIVFWKEACAALAKGKTQFQKQAEQKFEEQRQAKLRQLKIIEDQLAHDAYIMELREAKTPEQEAYVKAKHEGKRYQDQLLDPEDETTPVAALKDEDWSFFARIGYERPKLQMPLVVAQKKSLKPEWLRLPEIMNLRTGTRTQRPFQIAFYLCIFAAMLWLLAAGLNLSGVTGGSSLQQREHRVEQLRDQNQKRIDQLSKDEGKGLTGPPGQSGSDGHGGISQVTTDHGKIWLIFKDGTRSQLKTGG